MVPMYDGDNVSYGNIIDAAESLHVEAFSTCKAQKWQEKVG